MTVSAVGGTGGGTYGLSGSGMDIDALVKKLMIAEQTKADALVQKKTVLQWQKTGYNTIYDDLYTLRNTTAFNYKLQATLTPNKASSNNASVATATANASAMAVNHSLVVGQLASGVNLTSKQTISVTQPPVLGTLATQLGMGTASFNIKITNGSAASSSIAINPLTDTMNDVVSKLNGAGVNVQASYDSKLDRFFLATTNQGSSAGISFAGSDPAGLNFLGAQLKIDGVSDSGGGVYTSTPVQGKDAVFKLDGVDFAQGSNSVTVAGVSYNLTGTTSGATSLDGKTVTIPDPDKVQTTTVSVTGDVDTAVANIQSFVDSYNKMLDEVNGKLKETRYTEYAPLTDAQKSAMKDADITLWNTKAQSGMLHNDSTLTTLVSTMRSALSQPISGVADTKYKSAASIGITTGTYTEGGKLHLDTEKLKTALKDNPNVLQQLFGASGATTVAGVTTTDYNSQGIAGRLYDGIQKTMDKLKKIAGTTATTQSDTASNVAKSIIDYNKKIDNETTRFNALQKAYYTKYNAMELALSKLSSQSSWLTSQMSTSSG